MIGVGVIRMKKKYFLPILFISVLVFILFSIVSNAGGEIKFDRVLMDWTNSLATPAFLSIMDWISVVGSLENLLILTLLIAVVLFLKKDKFNSFFIVFLTISGIILNLLVKMLFQRARPNDEVSYIEAFGYSFEWISYSYPSGHTMRMTLFALFLMYIGAIYLKKKSLIIGNYVLFSFLILLVGLSRVALGVHYPSDVLASISLSIVYFCVCVYIGTKWLKRTAS